MLICWKFELNPLYTFCDRASFQAVCHMNHFIRFYEIDAFSRISLGLLLDMCRVIVGFQGVFILKGCKFKPFLVILYVKRRHANMRDVVSSSWSFRFCCRAPNSLNFNCSSCYIFGRPQASWLRFILASLIHLILSHILVNAGTVRNSAIWKMHSKLSLSTLNTYPLQD